jgi:hypothetical protein
MSIANTFPVFEADQVLTNNHLNSMFNYLDQQSRLSRIKLIGSGIVCGLEIKYAADAIHVSKGVGLTTQGFMVMLCDTDYKYYIPYISPNYPNDLQLITQCSDSDDVSGSNFLFYGEYGTSVLQLITQSAFDNLNTDVKSTAIAIAQTTKSFLDKYAVVLFLDVEELALKNCDTNDCDDKGSRMDFEVRALLVDKSILDKRGGGNSGKSIFQHVELKRYNVPVQDIKSADDVLNAFAKLVDDNDKLLTRLSGNLSNCWVQYRFLLNDEPTNPFTTLLADLKAILKDILKKYPVLVQYYYDFIDDLIKAYYEFRYEVFGSTGECCGDELRFPFHLMLGDADEDTRSGVLSKYRQYFIYSPLFDAQNQKLERIRLLFTRMKLMVQEYILSNKHQADKKAFINFDNQNVKITPSQYGRAFLSDRCIPYYYKVDEEGKELYRYWNYDKTRKGAERFNLSYNSNLYNSAENIVHPLLYEIEWFNFFRIEGHIGKPVSNALTTVKEIQQNFNLPFDVVALSADYIGAILKGEDPKCIIQDLESDYRVLIAEFICKVHDAFCFGARLPFQIPDRIFRFTASSFTNASRADASELKSTLSFNQGLFEKISHPFASSLVNQFQALRKYRKGDTLSKLCNPAQGTAGAAYIQGIKDNNGNFINPVVINADQPATIVLHHVFEFMDAVESMLELVMTNDLANIDVNELKKRNDRFEKEIRIITAFTIAFLHKLQNNDNSNLTDLVTDLYLDLLIANLQMLLNLCFVEQVEALKNEYERRMAQYRIAKNFNYYFKHHGGIEHKAGVPKGGTFILVYHEERRNRFLDIRSLFVNRDLSELFLTRFKGLLQQTVDLDEMEFNTQLLKVATLHRDPELFLRFRDVMTKFLDECDDISEAKRKKIRSIIDQPPQGRNFEFKDGMVIADFYVPYLCCSDCPPVAYILPPRPQDDTEDPTIKIEPNQFCNSDRSAYRIHVTPAGGVISGTGVHVQADGSFVFVPLGLPSGQYTITYTTNDKTVSVMVEVMATPIAKFSFSTTVQDGLMTVFFTSDSADTNDLTTYEWLLDGQKFSDKKDPDPISFKVASLPHTVLLNVSNGQCSSEFSLDIKLETEERTITLCHSVKEFNLEPNISGNDIVEVLSNDGIKMNDSTLEIFPASTPIDQTTVFHVSYMINGKQVDVTIKLIVINADFNITIEKINVGRVVLINLMLESKDKNYSGNQWKIVPEPEGVNLNDDPLKDVHLSIAQIRENKMISIEHILTVKTDNGECTRSESFVILFTDLGIALEKHFFDNHFQF